MPKITHTKFGWRCDAKDCGATAETTWIAPDGWVEPLVVEVVVGVNRYGSNVVACCRTHAIEAARARFEAALEEAMRIHFKKASP